MTSLADRTIVALRLTHDQTVSLVESLTPEQLTGPSGASEWTVAQVLSHLGSGSEIGLAGYRAALDGTPAPGSDFNPRVWERWNAMSPQGQASGFLEHDALLVETLEALTPEQRESTLVDLGFLPAPVPLATAAGMRLNETAQHAWDIAVTLDPLATISSDTADVLVEHFDGGIGFLLGFIGRADQLSEPAVVALDGTALAISVADEVSLVHGAQPTATLTGGAEALVRLVGGRLAEAYTPDAVTVTGNVTLADLRRVFPGY